MILPDNTLKFLIVVGDTLDSYAFDGSRVRKWNLNADDYGEKWEESDVIGCCIDLDEGCVEFFRYVGKKKEENATSNCI